ncbi:hypothetical protein ABVT39_020096 [Epinephelus coioides]
MAKRRTPHFWIEEETSHLVNVVKYMNIMSFVDGRKYRDSEIYKKVSEKLREAGFVRTPDQIKHRWKTLKKAYYKAKRQNATSGSDPSTFPQFDIMDEIFGQRPITTAQNSGVDVGFEDEQEQPDESDQEGDVDLGEPATPVSTASNVTSGSGSLDLEEDDDNEENGASGLSTQPSNATAPPQSTQPSNSTAATPGGSSRRSRPRGTTSLSQQ